MKAASVAIRKPLFFLINGLIALLFIYSALLYKEKRYVQEQNRQLIIQNDSIISVNILLNDSLKQKPPVSIPRKSFAVKTDLKR